MTTSHIRHALDFNPIHWSNITISMDNHSQLPCCCSDNLLKSCLNLLLHLQELEPLIQDWLFTPLSQTNSSVVAYIFALNNRRRILSDKLSEIQIHTGSLELLEKLINGTISPHPADLNYCLQFLMNRRSQLNNHTMDPLAEKTNIEALIQHRTTNFTDNFTILTPLNSTSRTT